VISDAGERHNTSFNKYLQSLASLVVSRFASLTKPDGYDFFRAFFLPMYFLKTVSIRSEGSNYADTFQKCACGCPKKILEDLEHTVVSQTQQQLSGVHTDSVG
jgi:hypothetical protein